MKDHYQTPPPKSTGNAATPQPLIIPPTNSNHSHTSPEARFWKFVQKGEACWNWTGQISEKGYGLIKIQGRNKFAHRVSFVLNGGTLGKGDCVLHSCDNSKCVNTEHLRKGTRIENRADCMSRGRQAKGESQGMAVLTDAAVADIRANYVFRKTPLRIFAERHGCGTSAVHRVIKNQAWNP